MGWGLTGLLGDLSVWETGEGMGEEEAKNISARGWVEKGHPWG